MKVCSEWYQRFELRAIDWNRGKVGGGVVLLEYVQNGIKDSMRGYVRSSLR